MIECPNCHTLSSESERTCLACGGPLLRANSDPAAERARCPAGHPVDPAWRTCPYCERSAPGATRFETPAVPPPLPYTAAPAAPFAPAGSTRLEEVPRPVPDRRTSLQEIAPVDYGRPQSWSPPPPPPQVAASQPPVDPSPAGRLVAVLAAPDIGPGGAVFPIRTGKTILGADRRSQVQIAGDPQVSNEHAILLYRDGVFHLTDRLSTNGSWVNGLEVPANGTVTLRDRDRLRLGNTHLVLLIVDLPQPTPTSALAADPS